MKKMKTTIAATVALAACVSTQVFAVVSTTGNVKVDTITMALTLQGQASVSTSPTVPDAGNFSQGPLYYKTGTSKFSQVNLLKAIAVVLHGYNNPNFSSSQASLQLVQGELGGFWVINDGLAQSYEDFNADASLTGGFNDVDSGLSSYNPNYMALNAVFFPTNPYGYDNLGAQPGNDFSDYIPNFVDNSSRTSISDNVNEFAMLDTGRHFLPVPWQSWTTANGGTGNPYADTGAYPVGHMQPWGQIYVKDPGHKDSSGNPLCENVTFFFYLEVVECYDCFYLNSFISDATFKEVNGKQVGPPCCTAPGYLTGRGVDKYYLSLSFDNTENNSYLNPAWATNNNDSSQNFGDGYYYYEYSGFTGLSPKAGPADGLTPDLLVYSDPIRSHLGSISPYETRFTLNGIMTYSWNLTLVNASDISADYVGTGSYDANGYGFIGLVCDLITGTATFKEAIVKDSGCCDDENWYDDEVNCDSCNGQGNYGTFVTGWFGVGEGDAHGYFDPRYMQYNPYPYYNGIAGVNNDKSYGNRDLPRQHESPFNPAPALTRHYLPTPDLDITGDGEDEIIP